MGATVSLAMVWLGLGYGLWFGSVCGMLWWWVTTTTTARCYFGEIYFGEWAPGKPTETFSSMSKKTAMVIAAAAAVMKMIS